MDRWELHAPLLPLPDESAGSLAWRCARRLKLSLHEFCRHVLRLDQNQLFADLDRVLCSDAADAFGAACQISDEVIHQLRIPEEWRRTTWDRKRRRHTATVLLCPQCLNDAGVAHRSWRSRFALACLVHQTLLIDRCPRCRMSIHSRDLRYQAHWLDLHGVCAYCHQPFPPAPVAPASVLRAAERWVQAMNGMEVDGCEPAELLALSQRLLQVRWDLDKIRTCWPSPLLGPDPVVGLVGLLINALCDNRHLQCTPLGENLVAVLCGRPFEQSELCVGLQREILPWGQLPLPLGCAEAPSAAISLATIRPKSGARFFAAR